MLPLLALERSGQPRASVLLTGSQRGQHQAIIATAGMDERIPCAQAAQAIWYGDLFVPSFGVGRCQQPFAQGWPFGLEQHCPAFEAQGRPLALPILVMVVSHLAARVRLAAWQCPCPPSLELRLLRATRSRCRRCRWALASKDVVTSPGSGTSTALRGPDRGSSSRARGSEAARGPGMATVAPSARLPAQTSSRGCLDEPRL